MLNLHLALKIGSAKIQFIFIIQQIWRILFSPPDGSQKVPYFYGMNFRIPREELHNGIYVFALAVLVCCLPLSRYVLSISQFILAFNWLAEGEFRQKATILRRKPAVLVFISVSLIYLAGTLYSDNIPAALTKVKNTVPLVLIPLVISTSRPLSPKNVSRLFFLYTLAVSVAAIICISNYLLDPAAADRNFRKLSLFIPHIRFSLLIIMAIFILLYLVFFKPFPIRRPLQAAFVTEAFFLAAFLFMLRSFAGILIFFLCLTLFLAQTSLLKGRKIRGRAIVSVLLALNFAAVFLVVFVYYKNFHPPSVDPALLDEKTVNGTRYEHNFSDKTMENGYYVNLYVCEPELSKSWNARSKIKYDSTDQRAQPVATTIKRYLTSKGLRKDSVSLSQLGDEEIQAIEKGRANYAFKAKPGFSQRLYETLWEIHIWRNTGYVKQHSFGQRIVYLQTAWELIRNNPLTGVGSGDVQGLMMQITRKNRHDVEGRWKGEPHNQFAFFLMAFGIPAFIWIMFSWTYPVLVSRSYRYLLFNLFAVTVLVSMLVLDTIESYDNMVFFAFFYSLFVFGSTYPIQENPAGLE